MISQFTALGVTVPLNTLILPNPAEAKLVRTPGAWAALEFASSTALSPSELNSTYGFLRSEFPINNPVFDMEYCMCIDSWGWAAGLVAGAALSNGRPGCLPPETQC